MPPKQTSTAKPKTTAQSEQTPVVETPVSVSAPVVETKAPKKAKKSAVETSVPVAVTQAPVVVSSTETNVVVDAPVTDAYAQLNALYADIYTDFGLVVSTLSSLKGKLKQVEKVQVKLNKDAQKHSRRKASRSGSGVARAPSGFRKPAKISNELATFLNKPFGSEMARTDVTKEINAYIRANNLQDAKNGRVIIPDRKLNDLLKVGSAKELTYFNLQRFMKPHFETAKKPVAVESSSA